MPSGSQQLRRGSLVFPENVIKVKNCEDCKGGSPGALKMLKLPRRQTLASY